MAKAWSQELSRPCFTAYPMLEVSAYVMVLVLCPITTTQSDQAGAEGEREGAKRGIDECRGGEMRLFCASREGPTQSQRLACGSIPTKVMS